MCDYISSDESLLSDFSPDVRGAVNENNGRWTELPNWLDSARLELQTIGNLSAGWDSHGGAPPERDQVTAAHELLSSVARACDHRPSINPTRSGGVQFEWETELGYVELETTARNVAEFYWTNAVDGEGEGNILSGEVLQPVLDQVQKLYSGATVPSDG